MAGEIEEILAELREYREELVHKNYPMGRINEIIMKWENKSVKVINNDDDMELADDTYYCLLYTSPSPRDLSTSRMPSSA